MHIVTPEATAWMRAADTAGVPLTPEVAEARATWERIKAEADALARPSEVPSVTALAAGGMGLAEASAEHERLKAEMARISEAAANARPAIQGAQLRLSLAAATTRDELIVGARPVLAALVDAARPLAETLAPFAPEYKAEAIVRGASPAQLKAYQKAQEMEAVFGTVVAAWRASFKATVNLGNGGHPSPARVANFDYRWVPQGHRFWENPGRVREPRLSGTYLNGYGREVSVQPTVLAVACEDAEAVFRLATVHELAEVYYATNAQAAADKAARDGEARRLGMRAL